MCRIKGLYRYIRKHGRHLTEELAYNAVSCLWDSAQVQESAQKKVYYNVTSATSGDMMYIVNYLRDSITPKSTCINKMLSIIEDYKEGKNAAFNIFLKNLRSGRKNFDLRKYI
jgi:hypothetical protein